MTHEQLTHEIKHILVKVGVLKGKEHLMYSDKELLSLLQTLIGEQQTRLATARATYTLQRKEIDALKQRKWAFGSGLPDRSDFNIKTLKQQREDEYKEKIKEAHRIRAERIAKGGEL